MGDCETRHCTLPSLQGACRSCASASAAASSAAATQPNVARLQLCLTEDGHAVRTAVPAQCSAVRSGRSASLCLRCEVITVSNGVSLGCLSASCAACAAVNSGSSALPHCRPPVCSLTVSRNAHSLSCGTEVLQAGRTVQYGPRRIIGVLLRALAGEVKYSHAVRCSMYSRI